MLQEADNEEDQQKQDLTNTGDVDDKPSVMPDKPKSEEPTEEDNSVDGGDAGDEPYGQEAAATGDDNDPRFGS